MRFIYFICLFSFLGASCVAQEETTGEKYFGQNPPTNPEVFMPGIVSLEGQYEFGSIFSKDGLEFYFGVDTGNKNEIRYSQYSEQGWTKPETILSHPDYGFNDPFLSNDEQELYFISQYPTEKGAQKNDHDIWYVQKTEDGWSEPINAGPSINTDKEEYYISFTDSGAMYFSSSKNADADNQSDLDIYRSVRENGEYQSAERLPKEINSKAYEADVFIAPDESYIIFCATYRRGLGRGDLYISFKQDDGSWGPKKNMGNLINTSGHELCPFVSKDGKAFFYTSNQDIYWVSAEILSKYK